MTAPTPHDALLYHAESTRHRGELAAATHCSSARNRLCGDQISLSLRIEDDRIGEIRLNARGCVISRAAASMLCEAVEGKPLEEVRGMTDRDVLGMIGMPLSPVRRVCGLLAWRCLQDALGESCLGPSPRDDTGRKAERSAGESGDECGEKIRG